jgi:hypothetical protein
MDPALATGIHSLGALLVCAIETTNTKLTLGRTARAQIINAERKPAFDSEDD